MGVLRKIHFRKKYFGNSRLGGSRPCNTSPSDLLEIFVRAKMSLAIFVPAIFSVSIFVQTATPRKIATASEIEITKIDLDLNRNLAGLEFKWWYQRRNGDYVHDHTYRYEPNKGMVSAWKQ